MNTNPAGGGPWIPENSFGARLRMVRRELGLSVEDVADVCGLSASTWSYWERGGHPQKMNETVDKITQATGVDRDWLMWGSVPTSRLVSLVDGAEMPLQLSLPFDRLLQPVP